jgi:hypothetical protein
MLFSSVAVLAGAVTQGFKTSTPMPNGAVVSLAKGSSDTIEKTTYANESSLIGVTAAAKDALIDLQPAGSLIRVAVSGDTSVLVSDISGNIEPGDQLVISSLTGITGKLTTESAAKKVIGTAGEKFDANSANTTKVQTTLPDGSKKSVTVGRISAKLLLNNRSDQNNSQKDSFLSSIGQKLTGKPTSPLKLFASSIIAVSTFALAGLILNGSIKGSFISLGRNPLSRDSIVSSLFRASLLAVVITGMGLALAYVILIV